MELVNDEEERSIVKWTLEIVQQPQRARMCGFGDKDRRPISPPIMIKLHGWNAADEEVPCDDIEANFFVLNADIWAENLSSELNMVVHPHIGSSGAPTPGSEHAETYEASSSSYTQPQPPPPQSSQPQPSPAGGYGPLPQTYASTSTSSHQPTFNSTNGNGTSRDLMLPPNQGDAPEATANVVGHLQASNHRLYDLDGNPGIWFIFHDLSVRTEGTYRLRLMLFNIGMHTERGWTTNNGASSAVFTCHTNPFNVYTAKKFPGMVDPTPLSKHFAKQGVRIPTRRGAKRKGDEEERDNEETA